MMQMQSQPQTRFVGANEYCRMLISHKHLVRVDEPGRARGLYDPATGVTVKVSEDVLRGNMMAVQSIFS